jgi:DNA helicase MCM9
MLEVTKQYECQNPRCRYRFSVYADPEQDNMLPQPRSCPSGASSGRLVGAPAAGGEDASAGAGAGAGTVPRRCMSSNLREVEGSRVCVDYQEVKVQDRMERLALGSVPRAIVVILEADLVDKFNAGS